MKPEHENQIEHEHVEQNAENTALSLAQKLKKYGFGIILSLAMTAFYFLIKYGVVESNDELDGAIFVNMIACGIYLGFTLFNPMLKYKGRFWKVDGGHFAISVAMLCISAYSVNLIVPMFHTFTLWTEVMLFTILLPLYSYGFRDQLPKAVNVGLALIAGIGMLFALYFSIYLVPAAPIGFIGLIIFGLGIHVFAPTILLVKFIRDFAVLYKSKAEKTAALVGIAIPLVITVAFLVKWSEVRHNLHEVHAEVVINENQELPRWVLLSQKLDDDFITEALLKSGIYYATPKKRRDFWYDIPSNNRRITKMHDPLVFMGNLFFGKLPIDHEDKLQILNSKYAARHSFESKLWTGRDLKTVDIINQVQIDPSYRYAYTEKTITIKNTYRRSWQWEQEALYTFHLPEGAVVSSLSLWVDGEERKSRLSTKQKATQAYNNIVGVQRRDPALAHWQEGNRVTVRVFPCTQKEDRMFKIGVTTPLTVAGKELVYDNFYFEGPELMNALETTKVYFVNGSSNGADLPSGFEVSGPDEFSYTGKAIGNYKITCPVQDLGEVPFCFNGNCYEVSSQEKELSEQSFNNVYLDINHTMSKSEFDDIWELCKDKKVYVFWKKMVLVTETNKDMVYEQLSDYNFTLFPIHQIKTENNLLITKSSNLGPNLNDLKKTKFKTGLQEFLSSDKESLKVISLNHLSDYWSSLNQFQVVDIHFETIGKLQAIIDGSFPSKSLDPNIVYIDNAKMQIKKVADSGAKGAPDHVLRMFNFNTLMKQIGKTYYNREQYEDKLFPLANEAFVLSPISSMVVLETDEDYDTHGIEENKNSLGNASMNSSGSVPEPHEWALIILAASSILYLYKKKRAQKLTV